MREEEKKIGILDILDDAHGLLDTNEETTKARPL